MGKAGVVQRGISKVVIKSAQVTMLFFLWSTMITLQEGLIFRSELFNLFIPVAIVFSTLSVFLPKKWAMSINRYKEANIIEKLSPLVFSIGMLLLLGMLTQTIAIVFVESFFFGNTVAYIAFLLADNVLPKILRFFGIKGAK